MDKELRDTIKMRNSCLRNAGISFGLGALLFGVGLLGDKYPGLIHKLMFLLGIANSLDGGTSALWMIGLIIAFISPFFLAAAALYALQAISMQKGKL